MNPNLEALIPLTGIVATFLSLTLILHTYFTTRNRERLALIAKNKDSSVWRKNKTKGGGVKFAIILISMGLGTFLAFLANEILNIPLVVTLLSGIPIFMGIGILFYHHRYRDEEYYDDEV